MCEAMERAAQIFMSAGYANGEGGAGGDDAPGLVGQVRSNLPLPERSNSEGSAWAQS